jgi:hypothetical protein
MEEDKPGFGLQDILAVWGKAAELRSSNLADLKAQSKSRG